VTRSFLRAFAPTQVDPQDVGMQPLPTGRLVYRTPKVEIGLRANEQHKPRDHGRDATAIQDWIRGSSWSSSASTTAKINEAPGVVERLRALLR
jgi:hypothetical protein